MCKCRCDEDFYKTIAKVETVTNPGIVIKDMAMLYQAMGIDKKDAKVMLISDIGRLLENPR